LDCGGVTPLFFVSSFFWRKTMKAILVREFGGLEVLKLEEIPTPKPAAGQVLVRIRAAGVNPYDTYMRAGTYAVKPLLPYTPGSDGAGVVEAIGDGVNYRWRPLTGRDKVPSLVDEMGYFYNSDRIHECLARAKLDELEVEFRAQIELALKYIPNISHLSAHMGCTNISPEVRALTIRLAREYKIPVDPEWDYKGFVGYDGPHKTSEQKIQSFINMLNKLEPGKTYIFLDHPGICNDELKAVYHIGYEDVAADRQGVVDAWTSDKVKEAIKKRSIQLISYQDAGK